MCFTVRSVFRFSCLWLRIRFRFKVTLVFTVDTVLKDIDARNAAPHTDLMTSSYFDCETGEFRLETHNSYHSGCLMEMTTFEAHECKGPLTSEKADGNRRAKSRGNGKSRARGDHACYTYKRGF